MKKRAACLWILVMGLLCTACGQIPSEGTAPSETAASTGPTAVVTEPTTRPVTEPTVPSTVPPTTEPEQVSYSVEGISQEEMLRYFNEVCLAAEYNSGGDPSLIQKWVDPILYCIHGDCTQEDRQVLTDFVEALNTLEGFPGMYEVSENANLNFYFCDREEFVQRIGGDIHGEAADGAVTFWYDSDNVVFRAVICIRTDIDQYTRNSVILEEIYNGLGPIQDTQLRDDSIIYAGFSETQSLTETDWMILKLLYHPDIRCGMTMEECEAVLCQLYR